MPTVGILIPGSTLYPSIGIDFLQGLRCCLKNFEMNDVNTEVATIGYGVNADEVYAAAEKMLLVIDADVVVAFAGDHHAARLAPLFASAGKLLIITNAGANYPQAFPEPVTNTLFHSLNDCLCCYLTGRHAGIQPGGQGAIMATSFFDGGYNHSHAMSNAFVHAGGEIKHNFVGHFKKDEFNTGNLVAFIRDNPELKKMLAVFSGDMARLFFEQLAQEAGASRLQWYGSPMMFDETPGDFAEPRPVLPATICGYTNWVPALNLEANSQFMACIKTVHGKTSNIFILQGWEIGLMLKAYFEQRKHNADVAATVAKLNSLQLNSPRGAVRLYNYHVLAPAYFVKATGKLELSIEHSIPDTADAWEEMCSQVPAEPFSSWRNTYLCI